MLDIASIKLLINHSLQPLTRYNYHAADAGYQIKLICILTKDRDQALISISTIKFSAQS